MKNRSNILLSLIMCLGFFQSCKKGMSNSIPELASIMVINAAVDLSAAKSYVSEKKLHWSSVSTNDITTFGSFKQFAVTTGNKSISAVNDADTTKIVFSRNHAFSKLELNTLFLCGQSGNYDGVLIAPDNLPNYQDSTIGIRVINLSPNSSPVNIVLSATPTANEFTNLGYKQISEFKKYPALSTTPSISFQVKNAVTGVTLAGYSIPITGVAPYRTVSMAYGRFKNITLVIKGLAGTTSGTNAFSVFPVPHY